MRNLRFLLTVSLLSGLTVSELPAQEPSGEAFLAAVEAAMSATIERSERSLVAIARIPFEPDPFDRGRARDPFGVRDRGGADPLSGSYVPRDFGTGLILASPDDPQGRLVLTCYHVVKGGQPWQNDGGTRSEARIALRFSPRHVCWATIYAADPRSDLAVLHFNPQDAGLTPDDLPPLSLGDDVPVRKGQFVVALGNPYAIARDGSPSASFGMISNLSRFPFASDALDRPTIHHYGLLLHVDTRLSPGTSGGALLNRSGQLIGITTSLAALEGYESSAGYAIPVGQGMRRVILDLLRGYEVEYGLLGVEVRTGDERFGHFGPIRRSAQKRTDVEVSDVMPDSPSHRAGLRPGDIIHTINRVPVLSRDDLFREVGLQAPGSMVRVGVRRNDVEREVPVQLARWPVPSGEVVIASRDRYPVWRGLRVGWPTSQRKFVDYKAPYPRAVIVEHVDENSPAEVVQLREGDFIESVNSRPCETPAEFAAAVEGAAGDVRLKLLAGREVLIRAK